ncbi:MAG TPA: SDR family NAD(P)-dependent oxidoreductase [Myxococcota bacterium]|nr:SDR family NAD(P)-dependent oxidoreductase [Myxococcota bacterium]
MGTATQPTSRVALVTGASSGIGEASARALGRAGFRVVLTARRGERLEQVVKQIEAGGGEALPIATDLADAEATSQMLRGALEAFGRIDVLVNNAGFSPGAALEQFSRSEVAHIFDVNLFAAMQLAGEVAPIMRAQGGGRIINVGSMGGCVPAPLALPYGASKAALDMATRGLRLELAPWRIYVSLVVLGFVDTAVFDNARAGSEHLRNDPDNPYRKLFFDLDAFVQKSLEKALEPDDVAALILRVATAVRPKPRYYAPLSARLQTGFLNLLPERWLDRLLLRVYKITPG